MQISVPATGKAIIYFTRARAAMIENYARMANCATCDKELAQSYKEAGEFFESLTKQIWEATHEA